MMDQNIKSAESRRLYQRLSELEDAYKATLNILEDFDAERSKSDQAQTALINILEDFNVERSKADQSQKALMNILEDVELERLKAEEVNKLLQASNKELESFSYSVSHDLRAPLRAISGFAEAVIEDYSDKIEDEGKRYLKLIAENAIKMGQLIDDLLSFSRLGRQEIKKSKIDMYAAAKAAFDELIIQNEERKINFIIHDVEPVFGDKSMIQQVLINLIANAIKFTRSRQEAVIEFGSESKPRSTIYCVKDNGVGFDMRYVDKLFGVFQRLHSVTEFEGTGVGLALVARIIMRHGGRVWAQGKLDEGAAFYFELPKGDFKDAS